MPLKHRNIGSPLKGGTIKKRPAKVPEKAVRRDSGKNPTVSATGVPRNPIYRKTTKRVVSPKPGFAKLNAGSGKPARKRNV